MDDTYDVIVTGAFGARRISSYTGPFCGLQYDEISSDPPFSAVGGRGEDLADAALLVVLHAQLEPHRLARRVCVDAPTSRQLLDEHQAPPVLVVA